jgi:hypothetical protein
MLKLKNHTENNMKEIEEVEEIEYQGNPTDWYCFWNEETESWIDFEVIWYGE